MPTTDQPQHPTQGSPKRLGYYLLRRGLEALGLRLACLAQGTLLAGVWIACLGATDAFGSLLRWLAPRPPGLPRQATDAPGAPIVSVIIPSLDGKELLAGCLPALQQAFARHPIEHEIIVVDNGSTDGSAAYLATAWPDVRLLRQTDNLGFIGGCNAGAAAARGAHLLFLNNDMVVDEDFLPPLLEGFQNSGYEQGKVAAVAAHIRMSDPAKREMETGLTVGRFGNGRFDVWHRRLLGDELPAYLPSLYAGGGSSLFSRRAFLELGGFDALLQPFYYEDVDLSYRAWQRGWQVLYTPRSRVDHRHRGTIGRLYRPGQIAAITAQNKLLFAVKNVRAWRYLFPLLLRLPFGEEPGREALLAWLHGTRRAVWRLAAVLARRLAAARSRAMPDAAIIAASAQPRLPAFAASSAAPSHTASAAPSWPSTTQREGASAGTKAGAPRILMLTPHFPFPLQHGGAVRMYHYIRCLAQRGYRISLLSFIEREEERAYRGALTPYCEHVELIRRGRSFQGDLWNLHPFAAHYDTNMVEALRRAQSSRRYDIVHCEYTNMGIYAPYISPPARTLLVEIDIAFLTHWRRLLTHWRSWSAPRQFLVSAATFRAELDICRRFDHIAAMSDHDAAVLRRFAPWLPPISVVPNGVSLADHPLRRAASPRPALLFVGYFPHPPNVEGILHFAQRVWPLVRTLHPEARLDVVGAEPPLQVRRLARQDGITVHGYVEDLAPFYEQNALFIAPLLRGSGTRLKILEAMARGIAVLASPMAAEGLDVEDGREVWLTQEPQRMAERIARALDDPHACRELAMRARRFVEARYDFSSLTGRYETIYELLLNAATAAREEAPISAAAASLEEATTQPRTAS